MIKIRIFTILILTSIIMLNISCDEKKLNDSPNIIYILADDLGYGELGIYGQEHIETPNIDALAQQGMIFTNHYSGSPVCAPSRSVLMTGLHTGNTPIRDNGEWGERGNIGSLKAMFDDYTLEGQRPLTDSIITIAQLLQNKGKFITVEVTPQHLTLFSPDCYNKLDSLAQMNPPIRSLEHQTGLWKGISNGTVDVIGSDHAPHTIEEKRKQWLNKQYLEVR